MPAITLYNYQRRWMANKNRFKVGMFARQTGKTFTTTLEIVDEVLLQETQGRKARWVILSRGERQAKEAMEEGIRRHCQAYGAAIQCFDTEYVGEIRHKALEATFPGGSRITALPANPDTARGFSADVFLDEFAFHQDSRRIWQALFPVVSAGHRLIVVSTPNGKGNKFYDLVTDKALEDVWYRQITDIYEAVADGLPRDIEALRAAIGDDDAWAQEFELKWLDEASAWLDFALINSVEHEEAGDPGRYTGGPCFIGNDIAARNDLWVGWVWEKIGDVLWTREIRPLKRKKFAEHDANMDELFETYRVARLDMDQTGMGEKPVEDAKRRYGEHRVEGVLFTGPNKLLLATAGKQAFEDRKVRIPMGDQELKNDLHKLKKVQTPTGAVRFDAESDSAGHADRTWAAFLGIYAAATPVGGIEYESIAKRRFAEQKGAW
jgi:phage FluMu gp28-like protein